MKTFTLTDEQFSCLMSCLTHAIDVYQDTKQPKTESAAVALKAELNRQAQEQS